MLERPIPRCNETLPLIGLGTWQTFDVADAEPLRPLVQELVARGGRLVDSSPMYGRAEEAVGTVAEGQPLFLATKVWTTGRDAGIRQMEDSMRKMRTTRIDLMQVHNLVDVTTHLATLRQWKSEGRVRYIGVTHYNSGAHAEVENVLRREDVDFLQINYSAGEREAEQRLLPLAADKGIAVIANRPFGEGSLLRRMRSKPVPEWAAEIGCTTWSQLLLKFIVSHPSIACAIPATSSIAHLRENMAAGEGAMPDDAMRERIALAVSA
jgi:diketogulonate reductase-like aldo/keto reductase